MKRNLKGETLLTVIISIMIISIAFVVIMKLVEYDNSISFEYNKSNYISILEQNSSNLIKNINTNSLNEGDIIYLYKTGSNVLAFTGINNQDYKYINYLGEHINTGSYNGVVYSRFYFLEKKSIEGQIIKCSIKELIKN
ncbi:MAG: hypothetical protein PHE25_03735 [Candidatus Gracilibacteria bacterium]|nr:hypothetical protein [Candidatus Gracilibacteria bacterium]